jgi:uncharacterized Actinobacterial protein TIGR03083
VASRSPVGKEFWLAALRAEGSAFLAAVSQPGVLSRRVPSCPDWSVGELVRHLGAFYQRIRLNAGSAGADEAWPALTVPEEAPTADDEAVVTWFREQLQSVEAHLESLDPDLPTWNWAPRARVAAFWHRRAAHETAVHRWDAQVATRLPEPIESKLAGDTIAEALDTFLPGGRRQVDRPAHGLIQLTATDIGQQWYVRLRGAAISLLDADTRLDAETHPARATAAGSASDLALALWGRVPFDVIEASGDVTLLEAIKIR